MQKIITVLAKLINNLLIYNFILKPMHNLGRLLLLYYDITYFISVHRLRVFQKAVVINGQNHVTKCSNSSLLRRPQFHALDGNAFGLYERFERYKINYKKRRKFIIIASSRLPEIGNVLRKNIFSYPNYIIKKLSLPTGKVANQGKNIGVFLFNDDKWENNYYHWHIDFLLFLVSLGETLPIDEVNVLMNRSIQPYQKDSLVALGIHLDQLKVVNGDCDNIILPHYTILERSRFTYTIPRDLICHQEIQILSNKIRQSVIKKAASKTSCRSRILISRHDALSRRLINQDELFERHLSKLNFEIVHLSSLDFNSQVSLFSNSECVIAPHGAGLTNIMYTRNCSVLEIFSERHGVRPDYLQLSNAVGCDYFCYTDTMARPHSDVFLPENILLEYLQKTIMK